MHSEHRLMYTLGATREELHAWLMGRARPSDTVFLRAVDVIVANERGNKHDEAKDSEMPPRQGRGQAPRPVVSLVKA